MRLAVVDLGSNTFHLLIVDVDKSSFVEVFRKRVFVGLGEGGLEIIKEERLNFGLEAVKSFSDQIKSHAVDKLRVTGTASLRFASNSQDFVTPAESMLGVNIEVIDGDEEADLIYEGVSLLPGAKTGNILIMDIGGGSTEFILCANGEVVWSNSYRLGVGVLHAGYHHSEPISADDHLSLQQFLEDSLEELVAQTLPIEDLTLIGASGSFEVLEKMSGREIAKNNLSDIDMDFFWSKSDEVIQADYEERLTFSGIPKERAKLIVVAMILIQEVINLTNPTSLKVSPYALKEGLLSEMIKET